MISFTVDIITCDDIVSRVTIYCLPELLLTSCSIYQTSKITPVKDDEGFERFDEKQLFVEFRHETSVSR